MYQIDSRFSAKSNSTEVMCHPEKEIQCKAPISSKYRFLHVEVSDSSWLLLPGWVFGEMKDCFLPRARVERKHGSVVQCYYVFSSGLSHTYMRFLLCHYLQLMVMGDEHTERHLTSLDWKKRQLWMLKRCFSMYIKGHTQLLLVEYHALHWGNCLQRTLVALIQQLFMYSNECQRAEVLDCFLDIYRACILTDTKRTYLATGVPATSGPLAFSGTNRSDEVTSSDTDGRGTSRFGLALFAGPRGRSFPGWCSGGPSRSKEGVSTTWSTRSLCNKANTNIIHTLKWCRPVLLKCVL